MLLQIKHITEYLFEDHNGGGLQQIRVHPKDRDNQRTIDWAVSVAGGSSEVEFFDQHHNHTMLVSLDDNVDRVRVTCEGTVETTETHGVVGHQNSYVPLALYKRSTDLTSAGKALRSFTAEVRKMEGDGDLDRLHKLMALIADHVTYEKGNTHAATTAEEAFEAGKGVCQDHAHIFITVCRLLGYPARYVSGYIFMQDRVDQEAGHAWAEVHLDGLGWVGFDPSNRVCPNETYVSVATGLDYLEAAPIRGIMRGKGGETLSVSVQVQQ